VRASGTMSRSRASGTVLLLRASGTTLISSTSLPVRHVAMRHGTRTGSYLLVHAASEHQIANPD